MPKNKVLSSKSLERKKIISILLCNLAQKLLNRSVIISLRIIWKHMKHVIYTGTDIQVSAVEMLIAQAFHPFGWWLQWDNDGTCTILR